MMFATDAHDLVRKIKSTTEHLGELIAKAYKAGIWIALGYRSWSEMCQHEFADLDISINTRAAVVQMLAGEGLSTRATASALGVDASTVRRDLAKSQDQGSRYVTGLDGKVYPVRRHEAQRRNRRDDLAKITLTLTVEDYDLIKHLARSAAMTVTEYMIRSALDQDRSKIT